VTEQFKEQGGFATMDPSPLMRWTTSRVIRKLTNPGRLQKARHKAEKERVKQGKTHCIEYFHQVDDAYSHLAAQAGLSWSEAEQVIDNEGWQEELEKNRTTMYGFDCWGVPSFRLLDADGKSLLAVWGQDRLWLLSRKTQQAIASRHS